MKKIVALILAVMLSVGLAVPAAAAGQAKATTMRLVQTSGTVTVKDAAGVAQTVIKDMRLYSGYTVTTGEASYAYISLDDSKAIKLDQNTSVSVKKSWGKLEVQLASGELFFNVTAPLTSSESLQIRTSTMVTGIRGSSGWITPKLSYFLTGSGTVICFDAYGNVIREYHVKGGEGVRGFPLTKPGMYPSNFDYEKITLDEDSFPWFVLVELRNIPGLRAAIEKEGVFNPDVLMDKIDPLQEEEAKEHERQLSQVTPPPTKAKIRDNQIPLFGDDAPVIYEPVYDGQEENGGANTHTVIFVNDDGTTFGSVELEEGQPLSPPEPVREGYEFDGWYADEGLTELFDLENAEITKDTTVYVKWTVNEYTITFDTDGGSEIDPITQDFGTEITAPEDPVKEGYSFDGWEPEIPETMPAQDLTVTAKWTVNEYTITFDTDGGSEIDPITQDFGTEITSPEDPVKEGYTFNGWEPEIPETMPAQDLTVTAKWTINSYNVSFELNGHGTENIPEDQIIEYNGYATNPDPIPTDPEYELVGWYTENGYNEIGEDTGDWSAENIFDFENTRITEDTKLYARWRVRFYSVTFVDEDGVTEFENEHPDGYTYNDALEYNGETPYKDEGEQYTYVFAGWNDGTTTYEADPDNDYLVELPNVTADVTYTAVYQISEYKISVIVPKAGITIWVDEEAFEYEEGDTKQFVYKEYGTDPEPISVEYEIAEEAGVIAGPKTQITVGGVALDDDTMVSGPTVIELTNLYTVLSSPLAGTSTEDGGLYAINETVSGDNMELYGDLYITEAGTLTIVGGAITNHGNIVNMGVIDIAQSGTLVNAEGATISNSGDITANWAGVLVNDGTIENNGTVSIQSGADEECSNTGTFNNDGALTIGETSGFTNSGNLSNNTSGSVTVYGTLNNSGTIDNEGSFTVSSMGTLNNSGDIVNEDTIVYE